jgi:hypothetical protein
LIIVKNTYRKGGGILGFWRGLGATLARDVPYSGLQFVFYRVLWDMEGVLFPCKNLAKTFRAVWLTFLDKSKEELG